MLLASQLASVRSHAQDTSMSVGTPLEHCDPCVVDGDGMERESLSQPLVNVSRDTCLIVAGEKPQACPALSLSKSSADTVFSQEYSQALTGGAQETCSQQPSFELLMSMGIKVRDFAYENTLPAIAPVPRIPRQVQPAPRASKRLQRDWDDKESHLNSLSPTHSLSGQRESKKPRSLERRPTEPVQEPEVQHTRTLERIMVTRVCSIVTPPSRDILPTTPLARSSACPPTSPLMPPLSHLATQESEFVQTPPTFPFVVHVDNTSIIPTSQLDPESRPLSLHPILYTRLTLESHPTSGCSPTPSPPQNASPAPLTAPFFDIPSPIKESEADPRVRKRRSRGTVSTTAPNRYQLRQRPVSSSRASTLLRCSHEAGSTSKPLPRRTRRAR